MTYVNNYDFTSQFISNNSEKNSKNSEFVSWYWEKK